MNDEVGLLAVKVTRCNSYAVLRLIKEAIALLSNRGNNGEEEPSQILTETGGEFYCY